MQESMVLQRVKERASALVAIELRSVAIVIGHLRGLILEAHDAGHSHKAIHAALEAAGLRATWNTYKSCLKRVKKAAAVPPSSSATAASSRSPLGSASPIVPGAVVPLTSASGVVHKFRDALMSTQTLAAAESDAIHSDASACAANPYPTSSATRVLDALNEARRVAASRDYAQIGRDLYRKQQRDQRNERISHSHQTKDPS